MLRNEKRKKRQFENEMRNQSFEDVSETLTEHSQKDGFCVECENFSIQL